MQKHVAAYKDKAAHAPLLKSSCVYFSCSTLSRAKALLAFNCLIETHEELRLQ